MKTIAFSYYFPFYMIIRYMIIILHFLFILFFLSKNKLHAV